jgi:hypothetical protein
MHSYAMPKFFGRAATRPSKVWQNWRAHLLMRRKFFGSAVAPPSKTFRHSLLAAVLPFATRYLPFAIVLGSAGASPSQFSPPTEVGGYENEACYLGCALRVES